MRITSLSVLPFLLVSTAAIAQEQATALAPVVVTANRTPLPAAHIGSSVSVVTRDELQRRGITRVYDALKFVPGVTLSRNGGVGGSATVRLRGSSSGQVKVLVDGMPINDPSNVDGSYDFNNLSVNGLDRIEVVRGPQSTLYGSDAIGGVINIITRKGEDGKSRTAYVGGGSYNTAEAGAELYDGNDRWQYGIAANYLHTDGFSHSNSGNERDGAENSNLNASLGYDFSDDLRVLAQGGYSRIYSDFDPMATLDGPAYLEKEVYTGQLKTEWQQSDRWLHSLSLQAIQTDRSFDEPVGFFRYSTFDGTTLAAEYQSTVTLADNQTLVAGLRSERQEAKGTSTLGGLTSTDFDGELDNHSVFADYLVNLTDATTLTLGGRYDNHDIFGGHTTGRATLSHQLAESTRLHASVGTGFKAPTLYQLYSAFGTPSLDAETSLGFDAGVEQGFMNDRLRLSATAYYNDFDDLIDFDPNTFIYTNIAEARTWGVENTVEFDATDAWLLTAGYTYLNAEDTQTDRVLPRRPKHTFTLGSAYTFEQGANLGIDLRYLSRQLDSNYSPDYTGSFTVVDLYGTYPINEKWELYGRVDNLFDRDYEEVNNFRATGLAGFGGVRVRF
jgi:vitamin B12 transporter